MVSLVGQWNEVMLEAIRAGGAKPTETTYQLHLVSSAVYDAWAAYDTSAYGYYSDIVRPVAEHTEANKETAISYAFYDMLLEFFPSEAARFDAMMAAQGLDPDAMPTGDDDPVAVAKAAVAGVWAARESDGSNFENGLADTSGYAPVNDPQEGSDGAPGGDTFDPNRWQPLRVPTGTLTDANGNPTFDDADPASFVDQVALTPHWGNVDPFALETIGQVRPPAPPQLGDMSPYTDALGNVTTGDQAYRDQFTAVMEISATLSTEEKVIAEYWADGPRTESPPGHWNQIAQDISLREGHGIDEDAKMFFALNAALFDAGIATWEAKYFYDFIRPQSAIRDLFFNQQIEAWGGPNQGTVMIQGQAWQPYQNTTFVTPPFPEYTSGHSSFSFAAADTIAAFVGSDAFFDGVSLSNYDLDSVAGIDRLGEYVTDELAFEVFTGPPVTLQWATLTEAAEDAGRSRIFGGIHIQDGDENGRQIGRDVADLGEVRWQALFSRAGDDAILGTDAAEMIYAGTGNDTASGGDADDGIFGEAGDDDITAGRGDDTAMGGEGADTLFGNSGADSVDGGDGADDISGGDGDDTINGGDGDDTVIGRGGDDDISGGDGEDVLSGSGGEDTIDGGADNDVINGGDDGDSLFGAAGEDTLFGNAGDDDMSGGSEADSLRGGDGNDTLRGDAGNDTLLGNAGADVIEGGTGNDDLRGGINADTFVFNSGDGTDVIGDFEHMQDRLNLSSSLVGTATTGAEVIAQFDTTSGGVAQLTFGTDSITFTNLADFTDMADNIFVV